MTDTAAPREPLIPADCDLTDFPRMPFDVARLRRSASWRMARKNPELGFYLVNLWMASWHESPAGSLEDDDEALADMAMCDEDRWPEVREQVLRNWVRCSDGRLYHETVATMVLEVWLAKLSTRRKGLVGNSKRHAIDIDVGPIDRQIEEATRLLGVLNPGSRTVQKRRVIAGPQGGSAPPDTSHGDASATGDGVAQRSHGGRTAIAQGSHSDRSAIARRSQVKVKGRDIPPTPHAVVGGQLGAGPPAVPWWETRSGIERTGVSLGLGAWDERAASRGQGEQFAAYSARVLAAAGDGPWMRNADAPMRQLGAVLQGRVH